MDPSSIRRTGPTTKITYMKRIGNIFNKIIDFDNLVLADKKPNLINVKYTILLSLIKGS